MSLLCVRVAETLGGRATRRDAACRGGRLRAVRGGGGNPAFMGLREAWLLGAPPPPWRPRSALCFWKSDSNVTGVALCDICPSGVPSCGFTYIVTNGRGLFFFFLRLNTTQLYVSKPVPLSIVRGWTVGVASASWPR